MKTKSYELWPGRVVYPCPECGDEFQTPDDVDRHLESECVGGGDYEDLIAERRYESWKEDRL